MRNGFNEFFEINDLEWGWNNVEGLEVKPIFSPHPVETNIFLFRALWHERHLVYAHFADIISLSELKKMVDVSEGKISMEWYDRISRYYHTPVDLKKIDIGGGLIHGDAHDFKDDFSQKIVLAHTASPLTNEQKEIGSEASFGLVDVLIPAAQDYRLRYASDCLTAYFPTVPYHELRILLNSPVHSFNAGTILLKKGCVAEQIFLILSGTVEFLHATSKMRNKISTGSLIGELSGLLQIPTRGTARTASSIDVLIFPSAFYREFAGRNNLYRDIKMIHEKKSFLQSTWLFGEMISSLTEARIVRAIEEINVEAGEVIPLVNEPIIYLLETGEVELSYKKKKVGDLTCGDFFGEETVLMNPPRMFRAVATKPTRICRIPGAQLEEIPIVRWKLLQVFEKRLKVLSRRVSLLGGRFKDLLK